MHIKPLSPNGARLCDVFPDDLLQEIIDLVDTFTPTRIQTADDAPELLTPLSGSDRHVLLLANTELRQRILACFDVPKSSSIELWRDYPGYRNTIHVDFENVHNVIIVYLDTWGHGEMGTKYYEDDAEYFVEYRKNHGIMLHNSNKILHHMIGEVAHVSYRKTLYINWTNK